MCVVKINKWNELLCVLRDIAAALQKPKLPLRISSGRLVITNSVGEELMISVKDDRQDDNYTFTPGEVTDAEGNPADSSGVSYTVESSDDSVASITPSDSNNPLSGTVHWGAPGTALLTIKGFLPGGVDPALVVTQSVLVTAGDPANINTGTLTIGDLVDDGTG